MSNKVKIKPAMMKWARKYAGFVNGHEEQLPADIKSNYESWENGEKLPTWDQLRRVSEIYKLPTSFFFMIKPFLLDFSELKDEKKSDLVLNKGKVVLNQCHLKYIGMLETLAHNLKNDDDLYELSALLFSIDSYFSDLCSNLRIKSQEDLVKFKNSLDVSLILMEGAVEDNDIDLAYESYFQIKRRVNKGKFYNKKGVLK